MAQATPRHITLPPRRVFGTPGQDHAPEDSPIDTNGVAARIMSFSRRRPSWGRSNATDDDRPLGDKPPIPSALPTGGEQYSTALPILPMAVLSIAMMGEFLSANVSTPFLLFMVEGFGGFTEESDVGYWTGILVSVFFLAQFLTSLLWATVANKHGQRAVLFVSLLGSAVACFAFGTATSLGQAIAIRLMQGVFAGSIGVARGSVINLTDPSNEGRAYAILGFCWGFGGVAGAIIGGTLESPAQRWPESFGNIPFLVKYPYAFPCAVAASITLFGSFLSLFLAYDGGPRQGAIQLPPEKATDRVGPEPMDTIDEHDTEDQVPFQHSAPINVVGSIGKRLSKKVSGYFAQRVHDAHATGQATPTRGDSAAPFSPPRTHVPLSRTTAADGSAYGYGGTYRQRIASLNSRTRARSASLANAVQRRRYTTGQDASGAGSFGSAQGSEIKLNLAQRLLMANENAVTNIADLWVAAAMNVDNEEVFEDDMSDVDRVVGEETGEGEDPFAPDWSRGAAAAGHIADTTVLDDSDDDDDDEMEIGDALNNTPTRLARLSRTSLSQTSYASPNRKPSTSNPFLSLRRPGPPLAQHRSLSSSQWSSGGGAGGSGSARRASAVPSIFSHTGVRTPPAVVDDSMSISMPMPGRADLGPIEESRPTSFRGDPEVQDVDALIASSKPPGLLAQLPLAVIIQYGLLALHGTTHDQVFVLYLLSPYTSGGLNLKSGHFSQLVAVMCLAQIGYQFVLYPNIGPPRGRFSHLSMFRLGSLLFIPAYLSVILYRTFAHEGQDGNFILMTALVLSTAVRYCGATFAYTSVSILLNYLSPPPVVGLANGLAQSIVSLARFMGPILGGYIWSVSVQDNPSGYPLGFLVCAGVCALAIAHSFFIR